MTKLTKNPVTMANIQACRIDHFLALINQKENKKPKGINPRVLTIKSAKSLFLIGQKISKGIRVRFSKRRREGIWSELADPALL